MRMYVGGQWLDSPEMTPVISPNTGGTVDCVPKATADQIQLALETAVKGSAAMAALPAYDRCRILLRAAQLIEDAVEELARTITQEEGKPISESRGEASRVPDLLRLCAYEGSQLRGETLPLDAQSGAKGKLGFTLQVPCGVVLAITPFNYPLLLVMHKVGPALAAGNAVILKPADKTPLTALTITKHLLAAGLPGNAIQCITGSGATIGPALCADRRVRTISFTGSTEVGLAIARVAGIKKLSLELGSNCPMVVLPDCDLDQVAEATAVGGYANAGQVCISTQRILVHERVYSDFLDVLKQRVEHIKVGDPFDKDTKIAAMVSEKEAQRVGEWIDEAVQAGARLITGGQRDKALFAPTIVADVAPHMRVSCQELFGPAVAATKVADVEEALALANASDYGLAASIFTKDITNALRFVRSAEAGNVMVNWTPLWRADLMPYGGFKQSGIGKEGPRYAVNEMTEIKNVVIHGIPS